MPYILFGFLDGEILICLSSKGFGDEYNPPTLLLGTHAEVVIEGRRPSHDPAKRTSDTRVADGDSTTPCYRFTIAPISQGL